MGIMRILNKYAGHLPAGNFAAILDGTEHLTTQEVAREIFLERGSSLDQLITVAREHFAGGYRGTTSDAFHEKVLLAFGEPLFDYPEAIRKRHQEKATQFWGGIASFAGAMTRSLSATSNQEAILESGRDSSERV